MGMQQFYQYTSGVYPVVGVVLQIIILSTLHDCNMQPATQCVLLPPGEC